VVATITAVPDLSLIRAIAAGEAVRIEPGALDVVRQCREQALAALRDGRLVYGVNTRRR
jgi:histidine ammonia-lyase